MSLQEKGLKRDKGFIPLALSLLVHLCNKANYICRVDLVVERVSRFFDLLNEVFLAWQMICGCLFCVYAFSKIPNRT